MLNPNAQVAYGADARNVHRVSGVESGERHTLTMWFTTDPAHAEDSHVIESLHRGACHCRLSDWLVGVTQLAYNVFRSRSKVAQ